MLLAVSKDRPDGLLESGRARDTVLVLGDASRGALYLALRPAASNGESPSPPPPERRAFSDFAPASRSLTFAGEPLVPPCARCVPPAGQSPAPRRIELTLGGSFELELVAVRPD